MSIDIWNKVFTDEDVWDINVYNTFIDAINERRSILQLVQAPIWNNQFYYNYIDPANPNNPFFSHLIEAVVPYNRERFTISIPDSPIGGLFRSVRQEKLCHTKDGDYLLNTFGNDVGYYNSYTYEYDNILRKFKPIDNIKSTIFLDGNNNKIPVPNYLGEYILQDSDHLVLNGWAGIESYLLSLAPFFYYKDDTVALKFKSFLDGDNLGHKIVEKMERKFPREISRLTDKGEEGWKARLLPDVFHFNPTDIIWRMAGRIYEYKSGKWEYNKDLILPDVVDFNFGGDINQPQIVNPGLLLLRGSYIGAWFLENLRSIIRFYDTTLGMRLTYIKKDVINYNYNTLIFNALIGISDPKGYNQPFDSLEKYNQQYHFINRDKTQNSNAGGIISFISSVQSDKHYIRNNCPCQITILTPEYAYEYDKNGKPKLIGVYDYYVKDSYNLGKGETDGRTLEQNELRLINWKFTYK